MNIKKTLLSAYSLALTVALASLSAGCGSGKVIGGAGVGAGGTGLTDSRDNQSYRTVKIGKHIWMAENLNYETGNSWCYNDDESNCKIYGRLYDWKTAKSACPDGWHLPTGGEWGSLMEAVGGAKESFAAVDVVGEDVQRYVGAGGKLKSKTGWSRCDDNECVDNGNGTDELGFSALPGGYRDEDGTFDFVGTIAAWQGTQDNSGSSAIGMLMVYADGNVYEANYDNGVGISVRCVTEDKGAPVRDTEGAAAEPQELIHLKNGEALRDEGKFDEALLEFNLALAINGELAAAYFCRGFVYDRMGDTDKAFADYSAAIRIDPRRADALNNRGNLYDENGDQERALSDYNAALALDPKFAEALANRAIVYEKMGDRDRALADYTAAIKIKPDYPEALANRGRFYFADDDDYDYDLALADLSAAIRLRPDYVKALVNRGNVYLTVEEYRSAIADCDAALSIRPDHLNAIKIRAYAHSFLGNHDRAIKDFTAALKLESNDSKMMAKRGSMYYDKGDYRLAIADWEAVLRVDPNDADVKQKLKDARAQMRKR